MTLEEYRQIKHKLENDIQILVSEFEETTKCEVPSIHVEHIETGTYKSGTPEHIIAYVCVNAII